jgi:hypothetical protein
MNGSGCGGIRGWAVMFLLYRMFAYEGPLISLPSMC